MCKDLAIGNASLQDLCQVWNTMWRLCFPFFDIRSQYSVVVKNFHLFIKAFVSLFEFSSLVIAHAVDW